MKVTSTEFQQNVGRYQDAALIEPVIITKNGRDKNVLISAAAFETLVRGRIARHLFWQFKKISKKRLRTIIS